jgi:hypothetical protein
MRARLSTLPGKTLTPSFPPGKIRSVPRRRHAPLDGASETEQAGTPSDDIDADFRGLDIARERAVEIGLLQRV